MKWLPRLTPLPALCTKMERTLVFGDGSSSGAVKLKLDMSVGIGGDTWPAADLFSFLIAHKACESAFSKLFVDKSVIELGSGTGLGGILVGKMYLTKKLVITDEKVSVLVSVCIFYFCKFEICAC